MLRVITTGICGSDLHAYHDARIGDTPVESPLIIGHEFSAIVEAIGAGALDVGHEPLRPGTRVAVDPAQPCGCCESCAHGHPNLCLRLHFCGNYPDGGSLCEWMHMPAQTIAGIKALSPRPDSVRSTCDWGRPVRGVNGKPYATLNLVRGVEILERDTNRAATAGQLSRQGAPAPGPPPRDRARVTWGALRAGEAISTDTHDEMTTDVGRCSA